MTLQQAIDQVCGADRTCRIRAQVCLDQLTKPPGSLGRLEDIAVQYAGMTGTERPKTPRTVVFTLLPIMA